MYGQMEWVDVMCDECQSQGVLYRPCWLTWQGVSKYQSDQLVRLSACLCQRRGGGCSQLSVGGATADGMEMDVVVSTRYNINKIELGQDLPPPESIASSRNTVTTAHHTHPCHQNEQHSRFSTSRVRFRSYDNRWWDPRLCSQRIKSITRSWARLRKSSYWLWGDDCRRESVSRTFSCGGNQCFDGNRNGTEVHENEQVHASWTSQ